MISDLHLGESVNDKIAKENFKLLSSKICDEISPTEDILFVILGDICDKGNKTGYAIAENFFDKFKLKLKDYKVHFDFIPGNHDLIDNNLDSFDSFIKRMGVDYSFSSCSAVSKEYGGVNFIFADSNLTRNFDESGKLNLKSVKSQVKAGMTNILFCHHALTHCTENPHNCVEDGDKISEKLREMGIEFCFHSHTHTCDITLSNECVFEIGCGSLSKNVNDMEGINNQFSVGGIRDGKIVGIERWIKTNDGNEKFSFEALYPQKRKFTAPEIVGKKKYDDVASPHIVREIVRITNNSILHEKSRYEEIDKEVIESLRNDNKSQPAKTSTLDKVIGGNGRIFLVGNAGDGKTVALKKMACDLYETPFFPVFYYLKDYTGNEICDILPEEYNDLNPNRLVLIFDGYDEIQEKYRHDFEGKLNTFLEKMPAVRVIVSSRKNFCKMSENGESYAMRNFDVYEFKQISDKEIDEYLLKLKIDKNEFRNSAKKSRVYELILNPFYLDGLAFIYHSENKLPSKSNVMKKIIEKRFMNDEEKFSNFDLFKRKHQIYTFLEKTAFAMQLMNKKQLSGDEYVEIILPEQQDWIIPSGLFFFSNDSFEFTHNNFREYLAASFLKKKSVDKILKYCCYENTLKPSWANTFGYLIGLSNDVDLKKWAVENASEILVKYKPDNFDKSERFEIFKRVFEKYEQNSIFSYEGICSESELANFSCSIKGINYLIDKVKYPANEFSVHNALRILQYLPDTCGKQSAIRDCLLKFCIGYPKNYSYDCHCAIHAMRKLELYNKDVTKQLMNLYEKSEDDFIRTGMYEYLVYTDEQDNYVQFFLDGIRFIGHFNGKRIGNESWALVDGLKAMSSADSISSVLEWFYKSDNKILYEGESIFCVLASKCSELYLAGNNKIFDVMYECWLWAVNNGRHKEASAVSEFFEDTDGYEKAVLRIVNSEGLQGFYNWAFLNSYPEIYLVLERLYKEDRLPNRSDFAEFVRCNCDCETYRRLAKTIFEVEGKILPEPPSTVDYNKERLDASLEYLSCLFDIGKYRALIDKLLTEIGNENITMAEIKDLYNPDCIFNKVRLAAIWYLKPEQRVKDFFKIINWQGFSINEIYSLIKNDNLQLNDNQKEVVVERVLTECLNGIYDNVVSEDGSFSEHVCNVTRFLALLKISLPKSELSKLTVIPWFGFSSKNSSVKYTYLEEQFSKSALIEQLICDVQNDLVDCDTKKYHIDYLREAKCKDIVDEAKEICMQKEQYEGLRCSAVKYLHELFGNEYIELEIIPQCDRDTIMCIAKMFNDISREELKSAMERVYCQKPDAEIQSYLITFNSEIALKNYLESVRKDNSVPETDGNIIGGVTQAISGISDSKLLPLLEELFKITIDSNFKDREFSGLRSSLYNAYVNCAKSNPQCVLQSVDTLFSMSKTEKDLTFCNRLKNDVLNEKIIFLDTPLQIGAVKNIISSVY